MGINFWAYHVIRSFVLNFIPVWLVLWYQNQYSIYTQGSSLVPTWCWYEWQQWQPSHLFRNHEERVTCSLATYLSQCTQWLHQSPYSIGKWNHWPLYWVFVTNWKALGRLSHDTGSHLTPQKGKTWRKTKKTKEDTGKRTEYKQTKGIRQTRNRWIKWHANLHPLLMKLLGKQTRHEFELSEDVSIYLISFKEFPFNKVERWT